MKFYRNPEIKRYTAIFAAVNAAFLVASVFLGLGTFILTFLLCAVLDTLFFAITFRRYNDLSDLATDIDKLLHSEEKIDISAYSEGELSVLQSELHKMTVRMREQAQSLADDKKFLSDSIADISHQIRTPLTSVNILVSMLLKSDLPREEAQEKLREIVSLLGRMEWLISSLLKMSKFDAGAVTMQKKPVDIGELFRHAAAPVEIPMELRNQTLNICTDGAVSFEGDIAWSTEALGNILKNCMEHTPDGGEITVRARESGIYTEITVTDTGSGISDEDLPHIFERFYKGKNSGEQNVGIGLALSRMIILAQNGTVKAENSQYGTGARFIIRFYKGTV